MTIRELAEALLRLPPEQLDLPAATHAVNAFDLIREPFQVREEYLRGRTDKTRFVLVD